MPQAIRDKVSERHVVLDLGCNHCSARASDSTVHVESYKLKCTRSKGTHLHVDEYNLSAEYLLST